MTGYLFRLTKYDTKILILMLFRYLIFYVISYS